MKKAKLLALVLAALLMLPVFTGCGGGGEESSSQSPEDSSSAVSAPDEGEDSPPAEDSSAAEDGDEPQAGAVQLPISEEKIEVTWFAGMDSNLTTLVDNMNETPFFQQLEEKTNIHIVFDHPAAGNGTTAYNLLFASGDLPDMISHHSPGYPGGLDACIDDGYILDLTDLVPEYCPNYMKAVKDFSE